MPSTYPQKTITINRKKVKIYYLKENKDYKFLNADLIRKQKLSVEQIRQIIVISKERDKLINKMKLITRDKVEKIKKAANIITEIDFRLQELWNFGQNIDFHYFWELPHCSCPKMDNWDSWGTKYHYYNMKCIIHGNQYGTHL